MAKSPSRLDREPPIDLRWGQFAGKMAVWIFWVAASTPIYIGMLQTNLPGVLRVIFVVLFVVPPFAWLVSINMRIAKGDEFEQMLTLRGLARGASFAVIWSVLVLAGNVIMEMIGVIEPGRALQQAPTIATLPPMAMFMAEASIQFERRRLANAGKEKP